jgi:flagellar basal-body rod protein FlgG
VSPSAPTFSDLACATLPIFVGTSSTQVPIDFLSGNPGADNTLTIHFGFSDFATLISNPSGAFHLDAQGVIVTSEGYAVQPQITIPANATSVSISKDGVVSATIAGQSASQQLGTLEIATFSNPGGLRPLGGNLFTVTTASGDPETGAPGTDSRGTVAQGFLEDSNVSVVEEMVNMIVGQRAYEANSRVVKAADDMLGQVNNLVR